MLVMHHAAVTGAEGNAVKQTARGHHVSKIGAFHLFRLFRLFDYCARCYTT
jgi:hypothetical protein